MQYRCIYPPVPAEGVSKPGQAVYISIAFGLGGAFGNYLAGQQWQQGTNAYETFVTAAVFAAIGATVTATVFQKRNGKCKGGLKSCSDG